MAVEERRYDVLVIGSGAAGSIAVKELTERGMEVLLLEAGRDISDADFTPPTKPSGHPLAMAIAPRIKAGVRGQYMQARRAIFSSQSSPFLVNDWQNPYSTPRGNRFLWIRSRILGGRLHSYGRVLLRMSDLDFNGASIDGNGADWPICYDDLAPYYDRVEDFMGLYGNADGVSTVPDGRYVGPAKLTAAERDFKQTVESAWPERKVISWRYAAPNLGRVPLGIQAARATGRLTTRTDAVVSRITVDEKSGRASGAVFVDRRTKQEHRVSADIVLLCASTIESIRILLNSKPGGLGNSSGTLGRYFMDQAPSLTVGSLPRFPGSEDDDSAPADPFYAPAGGVFVPRFVNVDGNLDGRSAAGFARGFSFQGALGRVPLPSDVPGAGGLMGFGEMLPYVDNQVSLSRRRKDAWGVPAAHIRCVAGDNERKLLREQVRVIREMFEQNRYVINFSGSSLGLDTANIWPDRDPVSRMIFRVGFPMSVAIGAAIHECGGARMGADPSGSVLNAHNQSWDVPNLFVTDGSCFASSGSVGPTLTITALTARACDYIAENYATGSL